MQAKYIIIEDMGLEQPIVFPSIIQHHRVAQGFSKVVSAGFCSQTELRKWQVWGNSVSLKLNSRPEDAEILDNLLEYEL